MNEINRKRKPSHKTRTPEEIEAAELRRKQKERERNRKARECLKAAQTDSIAAKDDRQDDQLSIRDFLRSGQMSGRTLESDLIYPHGKLKRKTLNGVDGFLLALQYSNPASLGKALSALGGTIYWLPPENDRVLIGLSTEAILSLPRQFSERLAYLAQFEVAETKQTCDRCKNKDVLYAGGKYGYPLRLLCFECSRFASATSDKACTARAEAEKLSNVLPMFRPIRKLKKAA